MLRTIFGLLAWAVLLGCPVSLVAQKTTAVKDDGGLKTDQITLSVGDHHVFKFDTITKPFVIEADAVLSLEPAPVYHDSSGKAVVVFGAKGGPSLVQVRGVSDNKTFYRALVTIEQGEVKPVVSPYRERLQKVLATEKFTAADLASLGTIFTGAAKFAETAATGKDVWDYIIVRYMPLGDALKMTRREVGVILGETTTELYGKALTPADRKLFKKVLTDIEGGLVGAQPGPGPAPVPSGPHKVYFVVIEEAMDRNQAVAALTLDEGIIARFKAKDHKHLIIDKDVVSKASTPVPKLIQDYLDRAKGKQLPFAVLVDRVTGVELYSGPLPTTPAGILELLDKVGG